MITDKAIARAFITPNEQDSNGEPGNVADGLFAIAKGLFEIAGAINDQTNRIVAVNQQIADSQKNDTEIQSEWLKIHKDKAASE